MNWRGKLTLRISITPPAKSAGMSGKKVFDTVRLSITPVGNRSRSAPGMSGSMLGTGMPLSSTRV